MFDRERVVAADKAEYEDVQRAYGRRMLHDVVRSLVQWSEARSSLRSSAEGDRGTRGDLCRRHRVLKTAIETGGEGRESFDATKQA